MDNLIASLEEGLLSVFESRHMPLYQMMAYHMGWADRDGERVPSREVERVHGLACIAACLACGGDLETAVPAAAAVELVENFSRIHDDVQGGYPQRDGRDTVWWIWGPAQAINAGDGMHALARLAMFRLGDLGVPCDKTFRAVQMLDEASLEVCEGRFKDFEAQERIDLSVDEYFRTASSKTGALYGCAMKLGALVASSTESLVEAFATCGRKIGIAVQVQRDLEELWPERETDTGPSATLLNKTKLLPVVYAVEKANISDKRRLGDVYFKRVLDADDVVAVREVVERLGGRKYCEGQVSLYAADAEHSLVTAGLSGGAFDTVRHFLGSLLRRP